MSKFAKITNAALQVESFARYQRIGRRYQVGALATALLLKAAPGGL